MGVVFFVFNAVFSLVLLIMLLVSSGFALFTKNPDTRYQPMRDDRGSFIKSQTALTTELDALGATARGEGKGTHPYPQSRGRIDDDDDYSSEEQRQIAAKEGGFTEHYQTAPPRSPMSHPNMQPGQTSYYERNDVQQQAVNNSSPWQRGAGYDH
jgi:hypothetical protein